MSSWPVLALLATGLLGCTASGAEEAPHEAAAPLSSALSSAEPLSVPRTEQLWLEGRATGVRHRLEVGLPHSYADGGGPYPLVLLLDTHYSFFLARNVADHLSERDHLPEVVVVGLGYAGAVDRASSDYRTNRTRDFTPVPSREGGYSPEVQKVSGGGPKFLRFLGEELLPALEERYRLDGSRTLVGHSYGGLFAVYAALEAPELFDRWIAVSPSLWYHDGWLPRRAASRLGSFGGSRAYLAVGSREGNARIDMVGDLRRFGEALDAGGPESLELRWQVLDDETHNSVFPRALSNGLRWVFEAP